MPDKRTTQKARKDMRAGKSASTAAGEFVHREIDRIRKGKHGAKNAKQAIAIGLSEARRAGIPVRDKGSSGSRGRSSSRSRSRSGSSSRAARSTRGSTRKTTRTSAKRSQASLKALRRMPRRAASHRALSRQAHRAARSRPARSRSAAARKAARTRAHRGR